MCTMHNVGFVYRSGIADIALERRSCSSRLLRVAGADQRRISDLPRLASLKHVRSDIIDYPSGLPGRFG